MSQNLQSQSQAASGPSTQSAQERYELTDNVPGLRNQESNLCRSEAWLEKHMLSLDGGGIRGYWTLLVLKRLMEEIGREEEEYEDFYDENYRNVPCVSSFSPFKLPENVSQIPLTVEEEEARDTKYHDYEKQKCQPISQRYLPCHYFDLICGTSTGALIAIMLGRLRMTVPDCIEEYKNLGGRIFANPRIPSVRHQYIVGRTKYSGRVMEEVLTDVITRRCEKSFSIHYAPQLSSSPDLCRTFITSSVIDEKGQAETDFFFRSYSFHHRFTSTDLKKSLDYNSPSASRTATGLSDMARLSPTFHGPIRVSSNLSSQNKIKKGEDLNLKKERETQHLPILIAAQAATAADMYFPPVKMPYSEDSKTLRLFKDGGISEKNNPSFVGYKELRAEFGSDKIRSVISIGTARYTLLRKKTRWLRGIWDYIVTWPDHLADPSKSHEIMLQIQEERKNDWENLKYERLTSDEKTVPKAMLDMELDEWLPRTGPTAGQKTIEKMDTSFNMWISTEECSNKIKDCAYHLVKHRRQRIQDDGLRWERFACGVLYRCRTRGCSNSTSIWVNKEEYKSHMREDHQVTPNQAERRAQEFREQFMYRPKHKAT